MRFFCHISFLQFSGELYSHLVLYFITIGFADYKMANFARYQNLPFDFSALRVSICECLKGLVHEKPLCGTKYFK